MINIKKVLLSVGLITSSIFGLFANCTEVKAESYSGQAIWPSEYISNIYIKKIKADGTGKYQQAHFIRRSEDNAFVYCLQPFVDINNNYVYNVARSDYELYTNMTREQFKRASLYAYYGYGYAGHSEHKWYAITQVLIWRTADPTSSFYFTDTLNGNRNDRLFANEIAELEGLVNSHYTNPEFDNVSNIKLPITNTISLNDRNNKLSEYRITEQNNVSASINGNTLNITGTGIGNASIKLTKTDTRFSLPPIVYFNDHSQNVFRLGLFDPIEVNLNFEVVGGKIKIKKLDSETNSTTPQGEASLVGAKYQVIDSNNNVVDTLTIGADNTATSKYLQFGSYTIKEIMASQGYNINSNNYKVDVTSSDIKEVNVTEDVIKARIKVNKYDSETNTCKAQGSATLEGAKYQILDRNGNVVDTVTIGSDCTAFSKYLPYGTYVIKEISPSVGYKIDSNNHTISIKNNSDVEITSREDVIKGTIKINKQDSETNSCKAQGDATLVGAKFNIINSKNEVVETITTGNDCTATSSYLPYDHYTIKEVEQPKGYYFNNSVYKQFIEKEREYSMIIPNMVIKNFISILKQYDYVDGTTQFLNAEKDIMFEIYNSKNELVKTITTDKNGYATVELPYGVYKLHQVNTNTGYEKIFDFYITVNETSNKEQYYNILNNKLSAYLQLFKKDSETGKTIALADTTFKILNTDTNKFVSQYVGGKVYSEFKTDETGKFITYLKLEAGNYKLVEVKSPQGYLINTDGLSFTLGNESHINYTTYGAFITVEFENTPIKGQIEIYKTGEVFNSKNETYSYDSEKLSDIEFSIYAEEDIKSSDGQHIYYEKGSLVDKVKTDKNGYAISKELPLGKYYVLETKTKDNYVLDTKKYHFELTEKDNKTPIVYMTHSVLNKLEKGTIEFTKTDLVTGDVIPNTKIEIYTADTNELIFSGRTDETGKVVITDLPTNKKFYIIETEPATGYVMTTEKVYFEIKENGEIVKANMANKPITSKLVFTKTDVSTSEALPNTLIEIYNADTNELVFSGRTDENGMIIIDEIRYGNYYIIEKEAPESYEINTEKMYFEVKEDGEIIKAIMTDEKIIVEVPNTEKNENFVVELLCGIVCISGIGLVIYAKKKNEEE